MAVRNHGDLKKFAEASLPAPYDAIQIVSPIPKKVCASYERRRLVLPKRIDAWSLTSLQQRLVKTGGRLVKHARYYWLLLAEGHLHRQLFGQILWLIWALPTPSG